MTDAPDFDWDNDESVVVRAQLAIAVYENVRGNIVIREESGNIVAISPQHVLAVARAMLAVAELPVEIVARPGASEIANSEQPKKDHTAAERQRRHRAKHRDSRDNGRDTNRDAVTERDAQALFALRAAE